MPRLGFLAANLDGQERRQGMHQDDEFWTSMAEPARKPRFRFSWRFPGVRDFLPLRGLTVLIDWAHVRRRALGLLALYPSVLVWIGLFTVSGILQGLPWPPRWDDYGFAVFMAAVVLPAALVVGLVVRDFVGALARAMRIRACHFDRP